MNDKSNKKNFISTINYNTIKNNLNPNINPHRRKSDEELSKSVF